MASGLRERGRSLQWRTVAHRDGPSGSQARAPVFHKTTLWCGEEVLQLAEGAFVLGRVLPLHLGEAGQEHALLFGECGGDAHGDVDVVVAASAALQELHAL